MGVDPDTWVGQLEELVALQSIYGEEDFRAFAPPAASDPSGPSTSTAPPPSPNGRLMHHTADSEPLDLEALLAAGPPPELLGTCLANGSRCSGGGGGGGDGEQAAVFLAEALVHVEVPPGGLQLVLERIAPPPAAQHGQEQQEQAQAGRCVDAGAGAGPGSGPGTSAGRGGGPQRGGGPSAAQAPAAGAAQPDGEAGQTASSPSPSASPSAAASLAAAPAAAAPPPPGAAAPAAARLTPIGQPVAQLSPIRVALALPPGYPDTHPPRVELQALWLSPEQAASLCTALGGLWEQQGPGAPITFTWLDWLRDSALQHLGVTEQLVVPVAQPGGGGGPGGGPGGVGWGGGARGPAALPGGGGPEAVAVALLRYSARREQQKFNESNVRCPICMDEHLGARCARLPDCRDVFCASCLATHLRTQLEAGAVDNLRCPQPGCRKQLQPYVLQQLLTPAEFERWETLTLQRTLDKMEDLVYCPRCREPCLEDKDHCTLCPSCFYNFCSLCECSWHPGSACLDAEGRLALLEARRNGQGGGGLSATERARKHLDQLNELKSLALLQNTTKKCPCCSMGVEKIEGCNKMVCSYCNTYFCWRCNAVITGYDHFQDGNCVLFEQDEIDRWNAMVNGHAGDQRVLQVRNHVLVAEWAQQQGLPGLRLCHCVVCGQPNVKEGGNNNIRCWACNQHFCYLCRQWLRNRPGQHFGQGQGKCRQHSDD